MAIGELQVGWTTTIALPMVELIDDTHICAFITSLKLEKWLQFEAYEVELPQGIFTGRVVATLSKELLSTDGATTGFAMILIRLRQSLNAKAPIVVTELGIVME